LSKHKGELVANAARGARDQCDFFHGGVSREF
jgi:hypothetical protein